MIGSEIHPVQYVFQASQNLHSFKVSFLCLYVCNQGSTSVFDNHTIEGYFEN